MGWIYLAESEESPWHFRPGSSQSPTVKTIDTHNPSFCVGCGKESCLPHPSGTTCGPYEGAFFQVWTSFTADSHARTSVPQVSALELTEPEVDSGNILPGLLAKLDRSTFLWRTLRTCGEEGSTPFLKIWPRWGWMRDGACYQLAPLERHTHEIDCSYWPTPRASMGKSGWGHGRVGNGRYRKSVIERCNRIGWTPSGEMQEAVQGYPIGWTVLERWAIAWFRSRRVKRSKD